MLKVATMPAGLVQAVAVGAAANAGVAMSVTIGVRVGSGNGAVAVAGGWLTVGAGRFDGWGVAVGGGAAVLVSAMAAWTMPGVATNDNDWGAQAARLRDSAQHNKKYSGRMLNYRMGLVGSGVSCS